MSTKCSAEGSDRCRKAPEAGYVKETNKGANLVMMKIEQRLPIRVQKTERRLCFYVGVWDECMQKFYKLFSCDIFICFGV